MRSLYLSGYKCNAPSYAVRIPTQIGPEPGRYAGVPELTDSEMDRLRTFYTEFQHEFQTIYLWIENHAT